MFIENYHSNGKLLLTSEYLVLDGASALALPTNKGQGMTVEMIPDGENKLSWSSSENNNFWFDATFKTDDFSILKSSDQEKSEMLKKVFQFVIKEKPDFFENEYSFHIKTNLEFPMDWGWGSSSTFIANIANWTHIDPYKLLKNTFGGSGYDIACANASKPLFFKLEGETSLVDEVDFNPSFSSEIFFVHLNKKQNSRAAIRKYRQRKISKSDITTFSHLTELFVKNQNEIHAFCDTVSEHEERLSKIINEPTVKSKFFSDFVGTTKSLGAWGGDFIMAIGEEAKNYFPDKGFSTVLEYKKVVL